MKKLLLFFSFILFNHLSYSQNYQGYVPFPTSNAGWLDHYSCSENHYDIIGDTVINSNTYHMLYVNQKVYHPNWTGCTFSYDHFTYYKGAFRNDTLNKRIYYVASGDSTESLLYDFDLDVGDTLTPSLKYTPSSRPITVLRIDTVNYGGVWRKQFTLNSCDYYIFTTDTIRWIEGIGSTQSLLHPEIDCPFESSGGILSCMTENSNTVYPDSMYSCNLLTGLASNENIDQQKVVLFPNPSSGLVHIKSSEEILYVKIYDTQARLMETVETISNTLELPPYKGLYFIQLETREGKVYTKKIIKQ